MSEMEWLKLTPDDAEYQSSAEYSNQSGFPHGMVHVLRNVQRNESDLPPLPYGHGLYLTSAELAAIPIAKALVEAVRPAYRARWPHDLYEIVAARNFELAEQFARFMHDVHGAFAPFEEAADGTGG